MEVREMEARDIAAMTALGAEMWAESHWGETMDYSREKCQILGVTILQSEDFLGLVAYDDGVLVGMFVGAVIAHYFTEDRMSVDFLTYVHPDWRGGSLGPRMIKRYIAWARTRNVKLLTVGSSTGINPERIGKLFERLGFRNVGALYHMEA